MVGASWSNWKGAPKDIDVKQCVVMETNGKWINVDCLNERAYRVLCYSEKGEEILSGICNKLLMTYLLVLATEKQKSTIFSNPIPYRKTD